MNDDPEAIGVIVIGRAPKKKRSGWLIVAGAAALLAALLLLSRPPLPKPVGPTAAGGRLFRWTVDPRGVWSGSIIVLPPKGDAVALANTLNLGPDDVVELNLDNAPAGLAEPLIAALVAVDTPIKVL